MPLNKRKPQNNEKKSAVPILLLFGGSTVEYYGNLKAASILTLPLHTAVLQRHIARQI